ncbi:hypothetical protein Ahy_Scaffold6g107928 isoform B [Arachis hypogaea]|nr:hypothetical protein Ahy_Scaffold6g107928 isoform B [Arachis hypogaea]
MWQGRDALFIPKEVGRINLGLNLNQPIEVLIEIVNPINPTLHIAVLTIMVNSQIKILVIEESLSRVVGHKRSHVLMKFPSQVNVVISNIFPWSFPICLVLNLP